MSVITVTLKVAITTDGGSPVSDEQVMKGLDQVGEVFGDPAKRARILAEITKALGKKTRASRHLHRKQETSR